MSKFNALLEAEGASDLGSLHHVTAVTGDASGNVAFYTDIQSSRTRMEET